MKKITITFLIIVFFIINISNVYAGSIPGDILIMDEAQIYIARIISYDNDLNKMIIQPITKIKGDVYLGINKEINFIFARVIQGGEILNTPLYSVQGKKSVEVNERCLVISLNNDTDNYIYHISGKYPETLKIIDAESTTFGEEIQMLLEEGAYEKAEKERLEKNKNSNKTSDTMNETTRVVYNAPKQLENKNTSKINNVVSIVNLILLVLSKLSLW